jgi:hypothetical protein
LGFHRGGTTFVQRLLNCHEDVMIWGENSGLLAKMRRIQHDLEQQLRKVDATEYAEFSSFTDTFDPWTSPVDGDDVIRKMGCFLESLYRTDVRCRVWGFKEIRHCNRPDVAFLKRVLPKARLVLLLRDPGDLLMSDFRSAWSPARKMREADYVKEFTERYIRGVRAFLEAGNQWPEQVQVLGYEGFRDGDDLLRVLEWLGLPRRGLEHQLVDRVRDQKVGSSYSDTGRHVSSKEARSIERQFNRYLAAMLEDAELSSPTESVKKWYPNCF